MSATLLRADQALDHYRRRVAAAPRKSRRQLARRSDARFSRSQVYAAFELYKAGYSTHWLAERLWRTGGFISADDCRAKLCQAFSIEGFVTRTLSEANLVRHGRGGTCARCGCLLDERTRGCSVCSVRHAHRRLRGLAHLPSPTSCANCGCAHDERTYGCVRCAKRHQKRRARGKPFVAARSTCIGCDGSYDDQTPGCDRCRKRQSLRRRRAHSLSRGGTP